jgi:DNA-binding response OmpR family regulator
VPKRILVLEDEEVLYDLLFDLLSIEGYEVARPGRFHDLVHEMQANPPDAVIMDVNLKGADGLQLLGDLRAQPAFKDTYVLLTSGLDYRKECLQRGASDFLQKPYMPDELVSLLARHIKQ